MVASVKVELPTELTLKQAADTLGVSTNTVRRYLADGSLPARDAAPLTSRHAMFKIPLDAVLAMRGGYVSQTAPQPVKARRKATSCLSPAAATLLADLGNRQAAAVRHRGVSA